MAQPRARDEEKGTEHQADQHCPTQVRLQDDQHHHRTDHQQVRDKTIDEITNPLSFLCQRVREIQGDRAFGKFGRLKVQRPQGNPALHLAMGDPGHQHEEQTNKSQRQHGMDEAGRVITPTVASQRTAFAAWLTVDSPRQLRVVRQRWSGCESTSRPAVIPAITPRSARWTAWPSSITSRHPRQRSQPAHY